MAMIVYQKNTTNAFKKTDRLEKNDATHAIFRQNLAVKEHVRQCERKETFKQYVAYRFEAAALRMAQACTAHN